MAPTRVRLVSVDLVHFERAQMSNGCFKGLFCCEIIG